MRGGFLIALAVVGLEPGAFWNEIANGALKARWKSSIEKVKNLFTDSDSRQATRGCRGRARDSMAQVNSLPPPQR